MENVRLIRGRIKSAKNISQITKAMELVSASKMKKAQEKAESGKLYAEKIHEMVMQLGSKIDVTSHPLLAKPKMLSGKRLIILISTNKGLCGGLNSSLFRFVLAQYRDLQMHDWVTIGQKGGMFIGLSKGNVIADFSSHTSFIAHVPAIAELVVEKFTSGVYDGVDLVFNEFKSVIRQEPRVRSILPLTLTSLSPDEGKPANDANFLIEPSAEEIFTSLLPHYIENQIRDAILQAEASEHAARMVAMRNATDNAKSFIADLTLVYNKARQEKITYEISDIVTARAAIVTE